MFSYCTVLKLSLYVCDWKFFKNVFRGLPHRKLFDGSTGGKLAPLAISPPDETPDNLILLFDTAQNPSFRRPSVTTLVLNKCFTMFLFFNVVRLRYFCMLILRLINDLFYCRCNKNNNAFKF